MATENLFYCNTMRLSASPYDFNLKFLRMMSVHNESNEEKTAPTLVAEANVVMSPSHAKSMVIMLYRALQEYEALYGIIPLPESQKEEFEKIFGNRWLED